MKRIVSVFVTLFFSQILFAQPFTHADTLRGSNGPGRDWWDVVRYDLHVNFDLRDSTLKGYNVISYKDIKKPTAGYFQIDLREPLVIDSVILDQGYRVRSMKVGEQIRHKVYSRRRILHFKRDGNAWFVDLMAYKPEDKRPPIISLEDTAYFVPNLTVYYHGKPHAARNPPWDGGLVWKKDAYGRPFIGVACQGLGASVWYPCKDYQGDEPESASMSFTGPDTLEIISNGRMEQSVWNGDGTKTVTWQVVNPISAYCISPYLAKYKHFGEIYHGEGGNLSCDYWVIDSNLNKAKVQFQDVRRMLKAFEYWFGPYPFYEDGYKLVEAPYLGMEHQSAVAYGNHYENGYAGRDLSGTGWGLKWDFIIIHESAHEWWGNNITTRDLADMWVHEAFANYSESLFTEYYYGKEAGTDYIVGVRKNIRNDRPIIPAYGVNQEGSGDMYYKGSNMIHAIRQIINDDEKFRGILRGIQKDFYHQVVTGEQIEDYINKKSGIDFSKVFEQYLTTVKIPTLEYKKEKGKLVFRWTNCVPGFTMPVRIFNKDEKLIWIHPTEKYQTVPEGVDTIKVDRNFYVEVKER